MDEAIYFVYVIVSKVRKSPRFYVGLSRNVEKRVTEHNAGYTFSTKGYRPWELFFTEEIGCRSEAREREKYLKSGVGREMIRKRWFDKNIASRHGYLNEGGELE
jgi:putative endonuclease